MANNEVMDVTKANQEKQKWLDLIKQVSAKWFLNVCQFHFMYNYKFNAFKKKKKEITLLKKSLDFLGGTTEIIVRTHTKLWYGLHLSPCWHNVHLSKQEQLHCTSFSATLVKSVQQATVME